MAWISCRCLSAAGVVWTWLRVRVPVRLLGHVRQGTWALQLWRMQARLRWHRLSIWCVPPSFCLSVSIVCPSPLLLSVSTVCPSLPPSVCQYGLSLPPSLCLSVNMICPFFLLSVNMIFPSLLLSVCQYGLSLPPSLCQYCLSVCLSVWFVPPSFSLSVNIVCLSVCLSVCQYGLSFLLSVNVIFSPSVCQSGFSPLSRCIIYVFSSLFVCFLLTFLVSCLTVAKSKL